jgi:hypothetical protein
MDRDSYSAIWRFISAAQGVPAGGTGSRAAESAPAQQAAESHDPQARYGIGDAQPLLAHDRRGLR